MNRFRSSRRTPSAGAEDPTEVLRVWRDEQREERLADTREFPELLDAGAAPQPRGRRRVPVLLVAGVGALVVVAGVAIASAADRPTEQGTSGGTVSTAPAEAATGSPSAEVVTPPSSGGSDDTAAPGGEGGAGHVAPAPPVGGPDSPLPPVPPGSGPVRPR